MTDHSNPATRIFTLTRQVLSISDSPTTTTPLCWARIFHIKQPVVAFLPFDVAERLTEVRDEVLLLERALGETRRIGPHVYQTTIKQIFNMFSPINLAGNWQQVRSAISAESMNLLETFQETLPLSYEEQEISQEELLAIRKIADDLILTVQNSELSEPVKAFIRRHADMILRAIALYPIQGAQALREAQRAAISDIIENGEMVRENTEWPEMREVASVWKRIGVAFNLARGVDAAIRIGKEAWKLLDSTLGT